MFPGHAEPLHPGRPRWSAVTFLVLACVGFWVVGELRPAGWGAWLVDHLALWPPGSKALRWVPTWGGWVPQETPRFQAWQLLTYGFLHGPWWHLLANLVALGTIGPVIERFWGARKFLGYYLYCVAGAGVVQCLISAWAARGGAVYPTVGASGGVFGVLIAFALMFPRARLALFFLPIPVPALWFAIGYGLVELGLGLANPFGGGVAHFAHVGGMVFGLFLLLPWRRDGRLHAGS